jgi:hypothetical protein
MLALSVFEMIQLDTSSRCPGVLQSLQFEALDDRAPDLASAIGGVLSICNMPQSVDLIAWVDVEIFILMRR